MAPTSRSRRRSSRKPPAKRGTTKTESKKPAASKEPAVSKKPAAGKKPAASRKPAASKKGCELPQTQGGGSQLKTAPGAPSVVSPPPAQVTWHAKADMDSSSTVSYTHLTLPTIA